MTGDVTPYLALLPSEHADKPNFVAVLTAAVQPFADQQVTLKSLPTQFDLDSAVGVQLDALGVRVNRDRYALGPLADDVYRTLLRATVIANHWDGSVAGAYEAWDALFAPAGISILIIDHQDMSMSLGLVGVVPDADTIALLTGGYLNLKPAGVRIDGYFYPTVGDAPLFGFDVENSNISGFDAGNWAVFLPAS